MGLYFDLVLDLAILHFVITHLFGGRFFGRRLTPPTGSTLWIAIAVAVLISINVARNLYTIFTG
jgi:hypothetical protein